jgi:peptide/nickel transport system substrate-binding protein
MRRWRIALAGIGLGLSVGWATVQAQTAPGPLRWAAQNDVLTLDPHSQNHATTLSLLQHCYEGLTRFDAKLQIEPALATGWTVMSPTQVRFQLRRGVKFHDGTPFSADDVVFSFQRITAPTGNLQSYVSGIQAVRKVDAHTVDLLLKAPNPALLGNLTDFRIVSKAWAEKHRTLQPPDFRAKQENHASRNAMGTGPYKITAWVPEQRLSLVQNPEWWDAKNASNVTEAVYLPIKSDQTRMAALMSGEVDLLTEVPLQDVARLKADARLKLLMGNEVRAIFIGMDQRSPEIAGGSVKGANPFKDRRVREAMNLAIDRLALQRAIMRGLSMPAGSLVSPGVDGHDATVDAPLAADPARAKALLAEAGYPQGFAVPFQCPNNRYVNDEEICQAVVAMWARIGVRATLATEGFSTFSARVQQFAYPLYLFGWSAPTYDAFPTLQALARTRGTGADGSFNYFRLSDPALDALIDAAAVEMDPAKRTRLMVDAQARIKAEHYFIPLHHQVRPWAMKPNVSTLHRSNDRPEMRFTLRR